MFLYVAPVRMLAVGGPANAVVGAALATPVNRSAVFAVAVFVSTLAYCFYAFAACLLVLAFGCRRQDREETQGQILAN